MAQLYQIGESSLLFHRAELHDMLIGILQFLCADDLKSFVMEIANSSDSLPSHFLCTIAREYTDEAIVQLIIERFITDTKANTAESRDALLSLCGKGIPRWPTVMLAEACLKFIGMPAMMDIGYRVLESLINIASFQIDFCDSQYRCELIKTIAPVNTWRVFRVLALVHEKAKFTIDRKFVERLICQPGDELWKFFQDLIDKRAFGFTHDDGFTAMVEVAEGTDFHTITESFVYFLKSIVLFQNQGYITGDLEKGSLVVRTATPEKIDLLYKAFLFAESQLASDLSQRFLHR
jgi:hypothetical protein